MKRTGVGAAVVCMGILLAARGAMAGGIKEGKWSMTTAIQMDDADPEAAQAMQELENMPPEQRAMMQQMMGGMTLGRAGGGMGMSTTRTQCLTNDNPVPEGQEKGCQQTHKLKGNTVEFEAVCKHSRSTGRVTYNKDSMKGTIKSTQIERGQEKHMTIAINGHYVGPCD